MQVKVAIGLVLGAAVAVLPAGPSSSATFDCEQFLPSAPPVTLAPDDQALEWEVPGINLPPGWNFQITSPLDQDVSVQYHSGTYEDRTDKARVDLTGLGLPHDEPIYYFVRAEADGQVCETSQLALMISDHSPESLEWLATRTAKDFHLVAGMVLSYVGQHIHEDLFNAPERARQLCVELWNYDQSPCAWSSQVGRTTVGEDGDAQRVVADLLPVQVMTLLESVDKASGVSYCKTVRVGGSAGWYGNFNVEEPSPFAPFTLYEGKAQPGRGFDTIQLYASVTRAAQGGADVYARGDVGIDVGINQIGVDRAGGGETVYIDPSLNYTINGTGRAFAYGIQQIPGDAMGTSELSAWAFSSNPRTNEYRGGYQVYGGQVIHSTGILPASGSDTVYFANETVELPVIETRDIEAVRSFVRVTAAAKAEAALAGAEATTDVESSEYEETPMFVRANYMDMTILNETWYWRVGPGAAHACVS